MVAPLYRLKVLREGYCTPAGSGRARADGTITLLMGPHKILVDTGGPWARESLLEALRHEGLTPADIDHVVCTHGHSDHVGNLGLFAEATLIVSHDVSHGDLYTEHPFASGEPYRIDDAVEVIATPGHTGQDVSVAVRMPEGLHVVAGDLFECREDLEDESLWRRGARIRSARSRAASSCCGSPTSSCRGMAGRSR